MKRLCFIKSQSFVAEFPRGRIPGTIATSLRGNDRRVKGHFRNNNPRIDMVLSCLKGDSLPRNHRDYHRQVQVVNEKSRREVTIDRRRTASRDTAVRFMPLLGQLVRARLRAEKNLTEPLDRS